MVYAGRRLDWARIRRFSFRGVLCIAVIAALAILIGVSPPSRSKPPDDELEVEPGPVALLVSFVESYAKVLNECAGLAKGQGEERLRGARKIFEDETTVMRKYSLGGVQDPLYVERLRGVQHLMVMTWQTMGERVDRAIPMASKGSGGQPLTMGDLEADLEPIVLALAGVASILGVGEQEFALGVGDRESAQGADSTHPPPPPMSKERKEQVQAHIKLLNDVFRGILSRRPAPPKAAPAR